MQLMLLDATHQARFNSTGSLSNLTALRNLYPCFEAHIHLLQHFLLAVDKISEGWRGGWNLGIEFGGVGSPRV